MCHTITAPYEVDEVTGVRDKVRAIDLTAFGFG
jgi:hypothetical protein